MKKVLCFILAVATILSLAACGPQLPLGTQESSKVDIQKYVKVTYAPAYNGYAFPELVVDEDGLNNLISSNRALLYINSVMTPEEKKETYGSWFGTDPEFEDFFEINFVEDYKSLKNGDKVKIEVALEKTFAKFTNDSVKEVAKELGFNLSKTFAEYDVEELKDLSDSQMVVDIFEGVEEYVQYLGANGYGQSYDRGLYFPYDYVRQIGEIYLKPSGLSSGALNVIYENKVIASIRYSVPSKRNLSKGDTIEITADISYEEEIEKLGYIISTTEKTITVPDLGEYITTKEQLTAQTISAIKEKINEESNPDEICELYFVTYNPGVPCNRNATSFVAAIVYEGGVFIKGYELVTLYDVIIKPDGTLELAYNSYQTGYQYDTIDLVKGTFNTKDYTYEKIE